MKTPNGPYLPKQDLLQYIGEEKYRALVENSIHAYFLTSPDGSILESNHIAMSMFGYSQKEFLSLNRSNLFDHTDENLVLALEDRDKTGYISVEATGIKKNGKHFPIELSSVIFSETNGDVRTSIMVFDISERRWAEKKYSKNLELLHQAEQMAGYGSWSWDYKNRILDWSDVCFNIAGYDPGAFIPSIERLESIIHAEDREKVLAFLSEAREKDTEQEIKFRISCPDNATKLLQSKIRIIHSPTGEAEKMIGIVQDITTKEKTGLDLISVIGSITDGFFTLDNDWMITYWNKQIENISGIKEDQIVGRSFHDFFKDLEDSKLYTGCVRAKEENVSVHFEEFYISANTWIEVSAYPSETGLTVFCKNITENKTAEAAMKLSNERYDLVAKATNDLVWDWDIITGEIYRNGNGVKRVYGHSSNENIKTNQLWADNIHPEDRKKIDEQIAYYISSENESSFSFEYRYKREDGIYNYIIDKGYIIRNELGIVIRMIGAARDITEQKQTARNIEESEQRYKMFVQQSTEGIWRIELDEAKSISTPIEEMISYCMTNAYLAECNDAFARMYGYKNAEDIIGIPLRELMPAENPRNLGYLYKFFTNTFKVKDEISHETDLDGNEVISINNMVGIVEGGYIKRAWGTQRNVTEQKKAEQSLLASEEQYRYLFNNNPSCIFIWDIETLKINEVNKSAVELYGYTRKEFLQLTVLDIRPVEEHAKFLEMVDVARQYDVYKKTHTWRHITKKGQVIFMEVSSHNIVYNGKKCVLAIANNVTEKIQLENSLNEERQIRQKQITDAVITGQERERSELGEELHDNINQILASTRLYIECAMADETIRKDLLDKGRVLLDSAMKEIRKLSRTLLPPSLGEVSLLDALTDLTKDIEIANPVCISRNWQKFNEDGLTQKIKLTIFRIAQEQLNNIYKHARAKNISISLEKDDKMISLVIKDDGVGFDTLTKRTGVGLRNISSRAEVNNGTAIIESAPGEGCQLLVTFPVEE